MCYHILYTHTIKRLIIRVKKRWVNSYVVLFISDHSQFQKLLNLACKIFSFLSSFFQPILVVPVKSSGEFSFCYSALSKVYQLIKRVKFSLKAHHINLMKILSILMYWWESKKKNSYLNRKWSKEMTVEAKSVFLEY